MLGKSETTAPACGSLTTPKHGHGDGGFWRRLHCPAATGHDPVDENEIRKHRGCVAGTSRLPHL